MRPIDADAPRKKLVDWLSWYTGSEAVKGVVQEVVEILDDAPTLDVEPVRHGRWKKRKSWDKYVCSECSFEHDEPHNYCPNPHCGAKMDAKENNDA